LVDSLTCFDELRSDSGLLRRVAVHHGVADDTVPSILMIESPTVIGDSLVLGFTYDEECQLIGTFRYRIADRQVDRADLPSDLSPGVTRAALSPDGQYLAYVSFVIDTGSGVGVVRRWPRGDLALRTPPVPVAASDALSGSVRWESAGEVRLAILPDGSDGSYWIQFTAYLSTGALKRDTLWLGH
jgi:hypothetical protein